MNSNQIPESGNNRPEVRAFYLEGGEVVRISETDVIFSRFMPDLFHTKDSTPNTLKMNGLKFVKFGGDSVTTGKTLFQWLDHKLSALNTEGE